MVAVATAVDANAVAFLSFSYEAELRDIGGTYAGRCVLVLNESEHTGVQGA